ALRLGLSVLLRLFAPALPYITEEVWSWAFAADTGQPTIHRAPWPGADDLGTVPAPHEPGCFDTAVACLAAITQAKSRGGGAVARALAAGTVAASPTPLARREPALADVLKSTRVTGHSVEPRPGLADGVVEVADVTFAPAEER